jgi:hypothetical protein
LIACPRTSLAGGSLQHEDCAKTPAVVIGKQTIAAAALLLFGLGVLIILGLTSVKPKLARHLFGV